MTFREKLAKEHPGCIHPIWDSGCDGCPHDYGYEPEFDCEGLTCKDCWSREIPMTTEEQAAQEKHDLEINAEIILSYCNRHQTCRECPADDACRKGRGTWLDGSTNTSPAKQRAMLDAFEAALPPLDEEEAPTEDRPGGLQDSGERREFETGAVRDMASGKGRMDLLPWAGILAVSKHCENGAKKYGEHNVDKGIPTSSLCDSAARHLAKYLDGQEDEDHLVAAAWNLLYALQMREKMPEMVDTPWRKEK